MNPLSIRNQKCPNQFCQFYGQELQGNIVLHGNKYPRFKCKECGKTWVFNRNDKNYGLKKDVEKVESVLALLKQGISARAAARLENVSPGTVQRWKKKFQII